MTKNQLEQKILYFAYGSNLHYGRFCEQLDVREIPSQEKALLDDHKLVFNKKSIDGSSKANIIECKGENVYGVIYELSTEEKKILDKKEDGYSTLEITVIQKNKNIPCITYIANKNKIIDHVMPYDWYVELIISGAEHFAFPNDYIQELKGLLVQNDQNEERKLKHKKYLTKQE